MISRVKCILVYPQFHQLPMCFLFMHGGTTEDDASHVHGCLDSIVKTYVSYHNHDHIYAKSTIIHNLKNTLSDRVVVNHCVVQSLQSALDIELLELKCNVHPLDGIAKKCNTSLKLYDTEHNIESSTFGRECCAVNFMQCAKCDINRERVIQLASNDS